MTDDTHRATTLAEFVESAHREVEGVVVEGAEAFIDEQRVEMDATRRAVTTSASPNARASEVRKVSPRKATGAAGTDR
ncbi:hypothetical protein HR12_41125 [Microbacterium sp. SUBG005]|nr:hypothetical protein HR12_41125 [Microbacterium sp. SUBG005]